MADHHITSDNGRQLLGNRAKQSSKSDEGYQQKRKDKTRQESKRIIWKIEQNQVLNNRNGVKKVWVKRENCREEKCSETIHQKQISFINFYICRQ